MRFLLLLALFLIAETATSTSSNLTVSSSPADVETDSSDDSTTGGIYSAHSTNETGVIVENDIDSQPVGASPQVADGSQKGYCTRDGVTSSPSDVSALHALLLSSTHADHLLNVLSGKLRVGPALCSFARPYDDDSDEEDETLVEFRHGSFHDVFLTPTKSSSSPRSITMGNTLVEDHLYYTTIGDNSRGWSTPPRLFIGPRNCLDGFFSMIFMDVYVDMREGADGGYFAEDELLDFLLELSSYQDMVFTRIRTSRSNSQIRTSRMRSVCADSAGWIGSVPLLFYMCICFLSTPIAPLIFALAASRSVLCKVARGIMANRHFALLVFLALISGCSASPVDACNGSMASRFWPHLVVITVGAVLLVGVSLTIQRLRNGVADEVEAPRAATPQPNTVSHPASTPTLLGASPQQAVTPTASTTTAVARTPPATPVPPRDDDAQEGDATAPTPPEDDVERVPVFLIPSENDAEVADARPIDGDGTANEGEDEEEGPPSETQEYTCREPSSPEVTAPSFTGSDTTTTSTRTASSGICTAGTRSRRSSSSHSEGGAESAAAATVEERNTQRDEVPVSNSKSQATNGSSAARNSKLKCVFPNCAKTVECGEKTHGTSLLEHIMVHCIFRFKCSICDHETSRRQCMEDHIKSNDHLGKNGKVNDRMNPLLDQLWKTYRDRYFPEFALLSQRVYKGKRIVGGATCASCFTFVQGDPNSLYRHIVMLHEAEVKEWDKDVATMLSFFPRLKPSEAHDLLTSIHANFADRKSHLIADIDRELMTEKGKNQRKIRAAKNRRAIFESKLNSIESVLEKFDSLSAAFAEKPMSNEIALEIDEWSRINDINNFDLSKVGDLLDRIYGELNKPDVFDEESDLLIPGGLSHDDNIEGKSMKCEGDEDVNECALPHNSDTSIPQETEGAVPSLFEEGEAASEAHEHPVDPNTSG